MSYNNLARVYDILTSNIDYKKRAEYFNTIIKNNNINKGILLDLACGTGSLSEEFAKLGFDVIGVDLSCEMLSVAMEKKHKSGNDIIYLCQAMDKLDLYGTINIAICALDSINHITDIEILQKAFNKVSLFLEPNGLFIFDVNTPYKHKNILENNVFVQDYDNVYCVWQNTLENENLTKIQLDIFIQEDEAYIKTEECFYERAYSHEDICILISNSGLELLDFYADDTFEKPKENTQRVIYVVKKGE